jgi:hypothetical protein
LNFHLQAIGILEKLGIETNIHVCNLNHIYIYKKKRIRTKNHDL